MTCYLIRAGETEMVKIGYTEGSGSNRCRKMQAAHWETLRVLRTWPGDKRTENWLHRRFRDHHVTRDWFQFHEDMMSVEVPVDGGHIRWLRSIRLSNRPMQGEGIRAIMALPGMSIGSIAKICGVSSGAVSQWDDVPIGRVEQLSKATGLATCEIRPDFFPRPTGESLAEPATQELIVHSDLAEQALALLQNGESASEVADKLSIPYRVLVSLAAEAGHKIINRGRRKWQNEQIQKIRDLRGQGLSWNKIGEQFSLTGSAIRQQAIEFGIHQQTGTRRVWADGALQELKKLTESGLSTAEIGRQLGVSKNAVVGALWRSGHVHAKRNTQGA